MPPRRPRFPLKCPNIMRNLMILVMMGMIYFEYVIVLSAETEINGADAIPPAASQHVANSGVKQHLTSADVTEQPDKTVNSPKNKGVSMGIHGPLRHLTSDLCVHPEGGGTNVKEGNRILLFTGCYREDRIKYVWTNNKEIKHVLSKKCIVPDPKRNLVLSSDCSESRFELSTSGEIKYVPTGECMHVNGGSRNPRAGTGLVLHKGCGEERNTFHLITSMPVNLGKDIKVGRRVSAENRPKKVALSILITKEPSKGNGFIDSAAMLVQSVKNAKSKYNIELVAIVSKDVKVCRYALERIGFRVLEKELPLTPEEIRNPTIAQEIVKDGCCGIWELLKLHAWKLTEYDRVLQLDTDILFHRNFDELFEYDTTLVWTHGALGGSERLNGGFLVVRPNPTHFDEMVEIIKSGDFQPGKGWRGKCCWVYGGRTIQGILPYYYLFEQMEYQQEVERCKYNNMVEIDRCKTWLYENVTSNHFTVCQKPFHCRSTRNDLCQQFTDAWWARSDEVERALGLEPRGRCRSGYAGIDWSKVPSDKVLYKL
ncbi:hypothetical protein AAMO2058_001487700 [Amorphochlora amoebiformis]